MTKYELIIKIANEAGISKVQATAALLAFETGVIDALANGDTVQLKGFGTFSAKERAARTGRNPQTGETLDIPASKVPHFKPANGFRGAIN